MRMSNVKLLLMIKKRDIVGHWLPLPGRNRSCGKDGTDSVNDIWIAQMVGRWRYRCREYSADSSNGINMI